MAKQLLKQLVSESCPAVAIGQNKLDKFKFINQTNLAQARLI